MTALLPFGWDAVYYNPYTCDRFKVEADYVYAIQYEGGLIKHMTKIWNDSISLEQLGWV